MVKVYKCEGMVTKYVTMYVEAENAVEAWAKVQDGDLEYEDEGEVHDCDMDRSTIGLVNADELPRKYPRKSA